MPVSKRLRYEVLRRDNHTCRYCGGTAPDVKLTVDHVLPTALGGGDTADNLVAACSACNSGKSSAAPEQRLVDQVSHDAIAWAAAIQKAAAIRDAEIEAQRKFVDIFWDHWAEHVGFLPPSGAQNSVENLYRAGLTTDELIYSVRVASEAYGVTSGRFRYFCGVAWKRVAAMQEVAKAIYEADRQARG